MLALLLAACAHPDEDPAIVVVYTVDTLGATMAAQTDTCGALQALTAEYGLETSCLEGGVAPSSWTGESHTRFLWPENTVGDNRAIRYPECGEESVLGTIRRVNGGSYLFAVDNSVLGDSGKDICAVTRTAYTQGADRVWETSDEPSEIAVVPEDERPVSQGLDAFAELVADGRGVQMFVNAVEPGGHEPRCWFDPYSDACDALWDVIVSNGLVEADADREATWLDPDFFGRFMQLFSVRRNDHEDANRALFWPTIEEAVLHFRDEKVIGRLRRILDAAKDADRLGDLHLVVLGDHGENPCVLRGLGDDSLNCGHNGIPTEFTAFVPVYVTPSSMADAWIDAGLVGTGGEVWSTVNVARGLVASVDVPAPDDWGDAEPVGTATSWTCLGPDDDSAPRAGVHIEGDTAVRCLKGTCEATTFTVPEDETYRSTVVTPIPDSLSSWAGDPDWFASACGG